MPPVNKLNNFIPNIWSATLLQELKKAQVFAQLVNRDYQGEITAFGDTVRINSFDPITIGTYDKNSTVVNPEYLEQNTAKTLVINQAKYFAFKIDSVDQAQTNPKLMSAAMAEAAYGLSNTMDAYIGNLYNDAGETVTGEFSATSAYGKIVEAGMKLDENNVSRTGRWLVVSPWAYAELLKSDEFIRATALGDAVVQNGTIGSIAGFQVFMSNNLYSTSVGGDDFTHLLAGTSQAITMAEQLNTIEAYRPENSFSDAVKGLHLYGVKVVRPEALVDIIAQKP
jgi:N4-gp56 family major capsid protein